MEKSEKVRNALDKVSNGFEKVEDYKSFQEFFLDLFNKIMGVFSFQVPLAVIVFIIWFIDSL